MLHSIGGLGDQPDCDSEGQCRRSSLEPESREPPSRLLLAKEQRQAVVIDHREEDVWGDAPGIYSVQSGHRREALVPRQWLSPPILRRGALCRRSAHGQYRRCRTELSANTIRSEERFSVLADGLRPPNEIARPSKRST